MDLDGLTWRDVTVDDATVGLVPTGSTEQHGPHAPLGTDRRIAEEVARRGAERSDRHVLVSPSIPVGISEEHRHFAGTLWVRPDAFRAYVGDVARSIASHGIGAVVFVNGHGGNVAALDEVTARLTRDDVCRSASFTWFRALTDPPAPMGHAGPLETAALLAIDPDLVRADRLEAAVSEGSGRWGRWVGGTNLAVDVVEFSQNGAVGDPTEATAALGESLIEEAADALADVIDAVGRDQSDSSS
ncbi:MAG: creatininase family protein [Halobacteriota archaeon]